MNPVAVFRTAAGRLTAVLLFIVLICSGCDELQMMMAYRTPLFVQGSPEIAPLNSGSKERISPAVMTNAVWHSIRVFDECPERFAVRTGYADRVQILMEGHGVLDIYPDSLLEVRGHEIQAVDLVQGRCDFMPITATLRKEYASLTNSTQRSAFLKKLQKKYVADRDGMVFVKNPFWVKTGFSSTVARKGRTFSIVVDSNHLLDFRSFRVSRLDPVFTLVQKKKSFTDHYRYMALTGLDIYEQSDRLHFTAAARDLTGNWMKMRRFIPTEAFKFSYMRGKRLRSEPVSHDAASCRFQKRYRQQLAAKFRSEPGAKSRYYRTRASRNRQLSFYWKSRQVFSQWRAIQKARAEYAGLIRKVTPHKYWSGKFVLPAGGVITSGFGRYRYYFGGSSSVHKGVDIAAPTGTPLAAANGGKVVFAGFTPAKGNNLVIDHGLGVYSAYFHLADLFVVKGDTVQRGDIVGTVGNTGLSSGSHLHWEMLVNGRYVNPLEWVKTGY